MKDFQNKFVSVPKDIERSASMMSVESSIKNFSKSLKKSHINIAKSCSNKMNSLNKPRSKLRRASYNLSNSKLYWEKKKSKISQNSNNDQSVQTITRRDYSTQGQVNSVENHNHNNNSQRIEQHTTRTRNTRNMEISPIITRLDGFSSRSTEQSSINNQLPTETENGIAITKTHQITTATSDSDSFTNESSSVRLTTIKDSLKLQAAKSESERHEGELKSRISMVSQSPSNYRQSVNRGGLVSGENSATVGRSSNVLQRNETFTKFRRSSVMSNTHTPRISQEQDSSMTINNLNSNLNKNNNNSSYISNSEANQNSTNFDNQRDRSNSSTTILNESSLKKILKNSKPKKCVTFADNISDISTNDIDDILNLMLSGTHMVKVRSNVRLYDRYFWLDEETNCLNWEPSKKDIPNIHLSAIKEVRMGQMTESFHMADPEGSLVGKNDFRRDPIQESRKCFSIIYSQNKPNINSKTLTTLDYSVLDLMVETIEMAEIWVLGLTLLQGFKYAKDPIQKLREKLIEYDNYRAIWLSNLWKDRCQKFHNSIQHVQNINENNHNPNQDFFTKTQKLKRECLPLNLAVKILQKELDFMSNSCIRKVLYQEAIIAFYHAIDYYDETSQTKKNTNLKANAQKRRRSLKRLSSVDVVLNDAMTYDLASTCYDGRSIENAVKGCFFLKIFGRNISSVPIFADQKNNPPSAPTTSPKTPSPHTTTTPKPSPNPTSPTTSTTSTPS